MAMNLFQKSLFSLRSHLVSDPCSKSIFQSFIEDALGKTRQFLRVFLGKDSKLSSETFRSQHRLPVEYFHENPGPRLGQQSKFVYYRPGFVHNVTSRWISDSVASAVTKAARRKVLLRGGGPMLGFVGFALAKKPSILTEEEEYEGVSYLIRDSFSSLPFRTAELNIDKNYGDNKKFTLADFNIGEKIAKGCNAAVYSAQLQAENFEVSPNDGKNQNLESLVCGHASNNITNEADIEINHTECKCEQTEKDEPNLIPCSKLIMSHAEGEQNSMQLEVERSATEELQGFIKDFAGFNLAIKIMFNYSAESNAYAIYNAMHKETLPALTEFSFGEDGKHKVRKKRLKPHPNIVEMYFAFPDQVPLLPGASKDYPQALPVRLFDDGCGRNMTLFLVMKRYHCSLIDYLKAQNPSSKVSLLLFTQLMEALVHLYQNGVAHRDLKTDNILIDLSQGINHPKLAVTDFGCCLDSLTLNYQTKEISKGGNMSLMAPEIINAEPGAFSVLDYSKSDLWTVGALAYEVFGGTNPFNSSNSSLKNHSYNENELPPLPTTSPPVIQRLVKDILHLNPKQRPSQNFVATVCQILLHAPTQLLLSSNSEDFSKRALEWMFSMSAETFLEGSVQNTQLSSVEFELRHTFCCRIQYLEVIQALKYIVNA